MAAVPTPVVDQVEHEDRSRIADLVGCETCSVRCRVGLVEVVDEGAEFVVEHGYRDCRRGESGIAGDEDRSNGHSK